MLEQTVRNINSRFGWRNTRKLLGSSLGITAAGLAPFIERMNHAVQQDAALKLVIDEFWKGLIFSGTRLLTMYRLEDNDVAKIQSAFSLLKKDESSFLKAYPAPLSKEELLAADTDIHFAELKLDIINEKQIETAVLVSKAYYTEVIELDQTHLSDAGMELRANGGEIKCKTRQVTQCFNSVMLLPSEKLLIQTVDLSVLPRSESQYQQHLVHKFVKEHAGINLNKPIELFGSIQDLYEKIDGRVSHVSFITADGNTSSLKLKPSQQCLRRDSYHHGGEAASPILTKFKLGKIWDLKQSTSQILSVELTLPGKRTMLDNPKQRLYEAIASNCNNIDSIVFIVERILESVKSCEAKKAKQAGRR
ncbi:hypothetical protein E1628_23785 [Salmonella enterica subsp. enterica serovar Kentucky]|uniref:hypothetical protein n=1 Tax=Enterobacter cloacae complex TaxID=354276 RepID=UPI00126EF17A|nr:MULTISPECIES: hypothetical protein [Enterobacter cloacae complex]ECF2231847.1 hypothetical protein [Salmonella enterica subsp. enterica serovar Kentucky]MBW4219912.1 hypothetical protein [Enterobacter roggenkampii]MCM7493811.1 hypothetical protein [Enterobacter cloacae]HDC4265612.1 hypothetical protein [Enterobacter cloacae]